MKRPLVIAIIVSCLSLPALLAADKTAKDAAPCCQKAAAASCKSGQGCPAMKSDAKAAKKAEKAEKKAEKKLEKKAEKK